MDQWNRIVISEIDPHGDDQMIFNIGEKAICAAKIVSSQIVLEKLDIHMQKVYLGTDLTPFITINQK